MTKMLLGIVMLLAGCAGQVQDREPVPCRVHGNSACGEFVPLTCEPGAEDSDAQAEMGKPSDCFALSPDGRHWCCIGLSQQGLGIVVLRPHQVINQA